MKTSNIGLLISTFVFAFSILPLAWADTINLKHTITVDKKLRKYHSECRAMTKYANGDPAQVDKLTAYLRHEKKYPAQTASQNNSAEAVAAYRMTGFGARKIVAYCYVCAEKKGYGKWCTKEESVDLKKEEQEK